MLKYFKRFPILTAASLLSGSAFAQGAVDLSEFSPKFAFQTGTDCYAYATVFMALTTQAAYSKGIKNPDTSFAFSYKFTGSLINYEINKVGQRSFRRKVASELYGNQETSELGQLDDVFYVSFKFGVTGYNNFNGERLTDELLKSIPLKHINKPLEVFTNTDEFDLKKVQVFQSYLQRGKPIVISITQPQAVCRRWDLTKKNKSTIKHIVTIVGYRNNEFLIQNNYGAKDCQHYYNVQEINKMLEWAYVFEQPFE